MPAVGLWRDRVVEAGLGRAAELVRDASLRVSSLRRDGFLTAADDDGRRAALEDNRGAVLEAATLGARELISVRNSRSSFPSASVETKRGSTCM